MDLLCYWWQNSQCGIRTLSSDNVPESQHGAASTGGGHTLLSVLPRAKAAKELAINTGETLGGYCFPCCWRKSRIAQWSLWSCVSVWRQWRHPGRNIIIYPVIFLNWPKFWLFFFPYNVRGRWLCSFFFSPSASIELGHKVSIDTPHLLLHFKLCPSRSTATVASLPLALPWWKTKERIPSNFP